MRRGLALLTLGAILALAPAAALADDNAAGIPRQQPVVITPADTGTPADTSTPSNLDSPPWWLQHQQGG